MTERQTSGRTGARPTVPNGHGQPPASGRLDGLLADAAARRPTATALVGCGETWNYAALDRRVSAVAEALCDLLGGERGATVAVASVLHPDFAAAYFGALRAGAVVAVLNPLVREEELAAQLALTGARLALVDEALRDRLRAVPHDLPSLHGTVLLGASSPAPAAPGPTTATPSSSPGSGSGFGLTLRDLIAAGAAARTTGAADTAAAGPGATGDDLACLQFTSGTSGQPKAVRLTHRNLTANAAQVAAAHRLDEASVAVNHLPTFHPMHLNAVVRAGAALVLCPDPDPVAAVATADRHGATHLYSLPVRLIRLAADPRLPGLRPTTAPRIASGGSALPVPVARRLSTHFGAPVFQGYGLTEASPLTHCDDPDDPRPGSVGRPVADTQCQVVGIESRLPLPAGEVGEIRVRGPQLMRGYLGGPDGTGLAPDGWLDTGDVGRIDAEGRLFLVDRLKDVFKCDNFLVAPSEVEQELMRHPLVREAAVVDLPDAFSTAVAGAVVALHPGATAPGTDPAALLPAVIAAVNRRLPYYRRVRRHRAVSAVPRSGNGKIQRHLLREELLDGAADVPVDAADAAPAEADATRPPFPDRTAPRTERPTMPAEPLNSLFTVVNTFTLRSPGLADEFERGFAEHAAWMRARDGFDSHLLARRTDRPDVYVNLGWWTAPERFQAVLESPEFQAHAARFHEVVEVTADPSAGVLRIGPDGHALPEDAALQLETVTVHGDAAAFEAAYRAYVEAAAKAGGLLRADLARSLFARPGGWTAATWWADPQAAQAAHALPSWTAVREHAQVETVAVQPLLGQRPVRRAA